jgi:hypothetical protein
LRPRLSENPALKDFYVAAFAILIFGHVTIFIFFGQETIFGIKGRHIRE